jgi:hypothetical protein
MPGPGGGRLANMAGKKKSKKSSAKTARRKVAHPKTTRSKTARAKARTASSKKPARAKTARAKTASAAKRTAAAPTRRAPKKQLLAKTAKRGSVRDSRNFEAVADQDSQGLSQTAGADSESVSELVDEGNAFEAGVVEGVERADDSEGREVRTRELPEDDVPEEYLDQE